MNPIKKYVLIAVYAISISLLITFFVLNERQENTPHFNDYPVSIADSINDLSGSFISEKILLDSRSENKNLIKMKLNFKDGKAFFSFYFNKRSVDVYTTYEKEKSYYVFHIDSCKSNSVMSTCITNQDDIKLNIVQNANGLIIRSKYDIIYMVPAEK